MRRRVGRWHHQRERLDQHLLRGERIRVGLRLRFVELTALEHELSRLLDVALSLPPEQRATWLDALDEGHELKARLHSLLARAPGELIGTLPKLTEGVTHFRCLHEADELVGPYRLLRRLGAGSMGAVWLAARTDALAPAHVALKFAHVAPLRTDLQARLAREHELMRALDHANIARLFDAGTTDEGQPYLVLEYVNGRALNAFVEDERPSHEQRLQLFDQLVRAVAHAHTCRIVHRDLKPANVLVTASGAVRLLDFGIAKLLAHGTPDFGLSRTSGQPLTPAYASPEQLLGATVEEPSDVYSLGLMLFELLTDKRPYDTRASLAQRAAILEHTPVAPSTLYTGLDTTRREQLDQLVARALRKEPSARFPHAGALLEALQRLL